MLPSVLRLTIHIHLWTTTTASSTNLRFHVTHLTTAWFRHTDMFLCGWLEVTRSSLWALTTPTARTTNERYSKTPSLYVSIRACDATNGWRKHFQRNQCSREREMSGAQTEDGSNTGEFLNGSSCPNSCSYGTRVRMTKRGRK